MMGVSYDEHDVKALRAGRIYVSNKAVADLIEALIFADQMTICEHQKIAALAKEVERLNGHHNAYRKRAEVRDELFDTELSAAESRIAELESRKGEVMALFCEVHAPWDNKSLATIPVTCPSCIIESLTAEVERLKLDLENGITSSEFWQKAASHQQSEKEASEARVAELEGVVDGLTNECGMLKARAHSAEAERDRLTDERATLIFAGHRYIATHKNQRVVLQSAADAELYTEAAGIFEELVYADANAEILDAAQEQARAALDEGGK